jgi:hypothetical protein
MGLFLTVYLQKKYLVSQAEVMAQRSAGASDSHNKDGSFSGRSGNPFVWSCKSLFPWPLGAPTRVKRENSLTSSAKAEPSGCVEFSQGARGV